MGRRNYSLFARWSRCDDSGRLVGNPEVIQKRASRKRRDRFSGCRQKSTRYGWSPRLLIALHSPAVLRETGLSMCPPEKSQLGDRVHWWAVRSLQSGLSRKNREIRAYFAYFGGNEGGISLQSRLRGGGRSLALTFLRPNSLLTGKITGNLRDFDLQNRTLVL